MYALAQTVPRGGSINGTSIWAVVADPAGGGTNTVEALIAAGSEVTGHTAPVRETSIVV